VLDENLIADLVQREVVTDTFRRLDAEKKERLYESTIDLFGEYGYDGLSVDEICRAGGISKGSFFQYFPSKSHLLEFDVLVFDDRLARWLADIRRQETAVLARDRILYFYRELVVNCRLHRTEQRFYLFLTNALPHAGVTLEGLDLERHIRNYVVEIVRRGEETGEIRGDFDVALTAHLTSVVIAGLVNWEYSESRPPLRAAEAYLISFLFDGIKA
jgi:AcrR family transcriptional regulator